jgi:hypothetical protein
MSGWIGKACDESGDTNIEQEQAQVVIDGNTELKYSNVFQRGNISMRWMRSWFQLLICRI